MGLTTTQLSCMILTLLVVMLPGMLAARKIKSADDYNVGGRSAGTFMVAGTILGDDYRRFSYDRYSAAPGSRLGFCAWWFTLGSGLALIIMTIFYARPLRRSSLTTISEFFVLKFGKHAGPVISISSTAGLFFSIVANTITACNLIAAVFNISMYLAAVVMLVLVAALVFFGGISGSGLAGIFKMILLFGTICLGGVLAFFKLGGLAGLQASFPEWYWFNLFGNGLEKGLYSMVSMIIGVISTQTYIQALFSAKDSKTAAKGCLVAAVICIPLGLPSILIGMFIHVAHPEIQAVNALPSFLLLYLPEWLGGIGVAGLLLSVIGSIAGIALGIGTMISRDIFGALLHYTDSKKLLLINRSCVLLATFLAVIVAFRNLNSLILEWNYLSMALRGAGVFLPLTFTVLAPRHVNQRYGLLAMVIGVFVALTWKLFSPEASNTLFPSLFFNLLFLVPGWYLSHRNLRRAAVVERYKD